MNKLFTTLLLVFLSFTAAKSQFFNVSNINTDEFPIVSTIFVAKDSDNEFIKNATKEQFVLEEDGKTIPISKMSIECFEGGEIPELSITLIVDRSGSMIEPFDEKKPDDTPWKRVKDGVKSFLDGIKFVGGTQVSLVTFNGDSYESCPFTSNPQDIIDSLNTILPSSGTKYTPPYIKGEYVFNGRTLRPSAVSLLKTRPANMKRIAVFLTDGKPDEPTNTLTVIDSLNYYNITAYNITFLTNMVDDLDEISQKTNGTAFVVEKKEDLETIYSEIAREAQKSYYCKLSWETDYQCYVSNNQRKVDFTFKGTSPFGRATRYYGITEENVPVRKWDLLTYSFGNPEVGAADAVTKTLQLIIKNIDFKYEDIELIPDNQGFKILNIKNSLGDIIPKNTVIPEGDTVYVEVEFEQFDLKTLRTATLSLNGVPCQTTAELVGGTTNVLLDSPNGGEIYTTCDSIPINWSGVDADADVHISYSNDNFASDSNYVATTNGNSYNWKNLPTEPGNYKVKLRVDPVSRYIFALNEETNGQSHGASVELSNDELFVYTVGHYKDNMKVGNITHTSEGNEDIFINKFNTAGKLIWSESLGGEGLDSASGVCVDDQDQVYFTGATTKGSKFNGAGVGGTLPGSIFFIAKTGPNGGNYTVRSIAAKTPYTAFEIWGTKLRYDATTEQIIVQGGYRDSYKFSTPKAEYQFPGPGGRFTAYYNKDLDLQDLNFELEGNNYSDNKATTKDGKSTYEVGTIKNDKSFGPFDLTHNGNGDFYLTRFGLNEPSNDLSDDEFIIEKPTLAYDDNSIILFQDTPIEETSFENRQEFVINTSILPIEIDTVTFTGPNKDEFGLDRDFEGTILNGAGEAKDLYLRFTPKAAGLRKAFVNIHGVCADVITLELNGNGICDLVYIQEYNLGASNLNVPLEKTIENTLINNNNVSVLLDPRIINDPTTNFTLTNLSINGNNVAIGTPFELQPKDTLTATVSFLSSTEGLKEADLTYNPVGIGCGNISTHLKATGSNTDLTYEEVNFAKKRIQTVNSLNLEITNNGTLPVDIYDIYIDNSDVFTLNKPANRNVGAGATLPVEILFNPQAEGTFTEDIYIVINQGDEPITLNRVIGIGENPTAVPTLDCNGNSIQNLTTNVDLILTNNSTVSETVVQSLIISPTSDYTFIGGAKTLNTVPNIPIGGSIPITLEFTPTLVGANNLDITINSNTSIGNNTDDQLNDPKSETVTLSCNAIPNNGNNEVNFVGVLVCDSYSKTISIDNNNPTSNLTVVDFTITPPNTDFSITGITNNTDISPNGSLPVEIVFSPTIDGTQNATLTFNLSQDGSNLTSSYTLTGNGKRITYSTVEAEKDITPGGEATMVVYAEIPPLDYDVSNLDIIIRRNPEVISFEEDANNFVKVPVSNGIDWTWTNTTNTNTQSLIEFSGSTITEPLSQGKHELFTINYFMYLGSTEKDVIAVGDFPSCNNIEFDDVLQLNLSGVCALENRLVEFGLNLTELKTIYDNNYNLIRTEFTILFDNMSAKLEVLDLNGNVVGVKTLKDMDKGVYEGVIDANNLSTGLYFVRYTSGSILQSSKLMILK